MSEAITCKVGDLEITYKSTAIPYIAKQWLKELDNTVKTVALDFESTGLGHPSQEILTHLSVATSPTEGFVLICENRMMERIMLKWLVETELQQIWHNLTFDGKYIYQRTGKFVKNYDDTQQLAKTLLNHVDIWKAKTGLKDLMGWKYGDWAIAADSFGTHILKDPKMIKYAVIDAMATFHLWEDIQKDLHEIRKI